MYRRKTVDALLRDHARERAAWERERGQLLDRIMYMAEKPWSPPPLPVDQTVRVDPYEDFAFAESVAIEE